MNKETIKNMILLVIFIVWGIWVIQPEKIILILIGLLNAVILIVFFICHFLFKTEPVAIPDYLGKPLVECKNNLFMYLFCLEMPVFLGIFIVVTMDVPGVGALRDKLWVWIALAVVLCILVVPFLLLLRRNVTIFCMEGVIRRDWLGRVYFCTYDEIKYSRRFLKHGDGLMFYIGSRRVTINMMSTNLNKAYEVMKQVGSRGGDGWWWRWE